MNSPEPDPGSAEQGGYTSEDAAPEQRIPDRVFDPVCGIAAAVLPGLGHALLGERRRAGIIAVGICGLVLAGLLIGGIGSIDRQGSPGWFLAQAFLGPTAFLIDAIHQTRYQGVAALGRAEEIGTLYIAIAGLLNLIAIIDASFPRTAAHRIRRAQQEANS